MTHGSWVKSEVGHLGHGSVGVTHSLLCSSVLDLNYLVTMFLLLRVRGYLTHKHVHANSAQLEYPVKRVSLSKDDESNILYKTHRS